MSIRIAGQVVASAGSLTAHNHDAEAHPEIRALIEQGGGGGSAGSADVAEALRNQNEAEGATEHLYNWVGTLAEYEAQNIATEHPEWVSFIIDEEEEQKGPQFPLFYHTFADHLLNNASWLRSDTFSWQSGDMYVSAYNHLTEEFEGLTAETETVGSTEITFYRAEDGHKIVLADQESNVAAIYAETGIAWYYILDTENKRFKLPRELSFVEIKESELLDWEHKETLINGYIAPENGYILAGQSQNDVNYELYITPKGGTEFRVYGGYNNDAGSQWCVILNKGDKVRFNTFNNGVFVPFKKSFSYKPDERRKYLYFFVGNTVRNQTEINVGTISESLNNKADFDFGNVSEAGKETAISWGRNFVNTNQTVASGNAAIAGMYDLGFTDGKVRIGVFECRLQTSGNGVSEMSLYTDVVTNEAKVCATNNGFTNADVITVPFIGSVSINFPLINAGVTTGTYLKFIGYFE